MLIEQWHIRKLNRKVTSRFKRILVDVYNEILSLKKSTNYSRLSPHIRL